MKFIEVGIGNTWLVRTETELEDGTEFEERGVSCPIKFHSVYIRIWLHTTVLIIDLKEGVKKISKDRSKFKIVFGITSK